MNAPHNVPGENKPKPRLLDQVRETIRVKHYPGGGPGSSGPAGRRNLAGLLAVVRCGPAFVRGPGVAGERHRLHAQ
jgi:hypothetical protein